VKAAYPGLLAGLITQHLITGHQVELDGDRAVCRAHSINVHLPEDGTSGALVAHGNEYRFELERTGGGWRISGRQTWIRWRWGDETHYDVDRRLLHWASGVRPAGQRGSQSTRGLTIWMWRATLLQCRPSRNVDPVAQHRGAPGP
jgi:hypothetical protein